VAEISPGETFVTITNHIGILDEKASRVQARALSIISSLNPVWTVTGSWTVLRLRSLGVFCHP
jgi:hypothetical protein